MNSTYAPQWQLRTLGHLLDLAKSQREHLPDIRSDGYERQADRVCEKRGELHDDCRRELNPYEGPKGFP